MRANVLTRDTRFRRAYIRSVIDQVEVDDTEIRIVKGSSWAAGVSGRSARFCSEMARPKRFELLTPRFVVCRLGPITTCEVVEALTRKQSCQRELQGRDYRLSSIWRTL